MHESYEVAYPCPSCPPNKSPKCFLNTRKKCFHCYRCNASGRAEAPPGLSGVGETKRPPAALPETSPLSQFATQYLLDRGIALHLIEHLPIYTTGTGILFRFPEYADYWQERNWSTSGRPRWLGPSSPKASEGVTYHLSGARSDEVVLVEGVADALKVASAGFTTAALLSKRLYSSQAARLSQRYRRAALLLDRDVSPADWLAAAVVAREFFQLRLLYIHRWADPGDMPLEEIQEVLG